MVACAGCGAMMDDASTFCPACGRARMLPFGAPATPLQGRVQEPSTLLVLCAVTLTVYFYIWLWRVSGEIDAWKQRPGWSRNLALATIALAIVGLAVSIVSAAATIGPVFRAASTGVAASPPAWARWLGLVGVVGQLAATACLFRVWSALAEQGGPSGRAPLDPVPLAWMSLVAPAGGALSAVLAGTQLAVVGSLVDLTGVVLWFVVLHRTQRALNATWAPPAAPPTPVVAW